MQILSDLVPAKHTALYICDHYCYLCYYYETVQHEQAEKIN